MFGRFLIEVAKMCYASWHKRFSIRRKRKMLVGLKGKNESKADEKQYNCKQ